MDCIIRTAIVYFILLFTIRVTTRRVLRSATPMDLVLIFVFGGVCVSAILGEDHSITTMLLTLGTFSLLHVGISTAKYKWPTIGLYVEGSPSVVFRDGQWDDEALQSMRMAKRDIVTEVRQHGQRSMDEVELVVAEHNGGLSVIVKE